MTLGVSLLLSWIFCPRSFYETQYGNGAARLTQGTSTISIVSVPVRLMTVEVESREANLPHGMYNSTFQMGTDWTTRWLFATCTAAAVCGVLKCLSVVEICMLAVEALLLAAYLGPEAARGGGDSRLVLHLLTMTFVIQAWCRVRLWIKQEVVLD
jgi:hypothetical protein